MNKPPNYPRNTYPDFTVGSTGPPGPAGAGSSFVFRPGGVTAGNVYATQPALDVALAATQGPATVEIDDSIVTPAVLTTPTVAWRPAKVRNVTLVGYASQNGNDIPALHVTGRLDSVGTCSFLVLTLVGSSLSVLAVNEGSLLLYYGCVVHAAAGLPLIDASAVGATLILQLSDAAAMHGLIVQGGAAFGSIGIAVESLAQLADNSLAGPAGNAFGVTVQAGCAFNPQNQSGLTGVVTVRYLGGPGQLPANRGQALAATQVGVASPAGQVAGTAVDTNAPFAHITLHPKTSVPGKYRITVNLQVTTSAALATVTFAITARTAGVGNYTTQYSVSELIPNAGPALLAYAVEIDNTALPSVPADATGGTDFGVEVDVSAGTITTTTNKGLFIVEEM